MATAFGGVNVVGEGVNILRVAVVVLHGYLYLAVLARRMEKDRLLVQCVFILVEIADKALNASLIAEGLREIIAVIS